MKPHPFRLAALLPVLGFLACTSDEMVLVRENSTMGTSAFFIDRYEVSIRERTRTNPQGGTEIIQEGRSRAGMVPVTTVDLAGARKICEDAEKRLCTTREWLAACLGPRNLASGVQASPTSPVNITKLCAVARLDNTGGGTGGVGLPGGTNSGGSDSDSLPVKAGRAGACRTQDLDVFDLIGNLSEWTDNTDSVPGLAGATGLAMGPNYASALNEAVCLTFLGNDTDGDGDVDLPIATETADSLAGVRCCKDATPEDVAKADRDN